MKKAIAFLLAAVILSVLSNAAFCEAGVTTLNASGTLNRAVSVDPTGRSEGFSAVIYNNLKRQRGQAVDRHLAEARPDLLRPWASHVLYGGRRPHFRPRARRVRAVGRADADVVDAFLRLVDRGEFRDPDDNGGGSLEKIENIHSVLENQSRDSGPLKL